MTLSFLIRLKYIIFIILILLFYKLIHSKLYLFTTKEKELKLEERSIVHSKNITYGHNLRPRSIETVQLASSENLSRFIGNKINKKIIQEDRNNNYESSQCYNKFKIDAYEEIKKTLIDLNWIFKEPEEGIPDNTGQEIHSKYWCDPKSLLSLQSHYRIYAAPCVIENVCIGELSQPKRHSDHSSLKNYEMRECLSTFKLDYGFPEIQLSQGTKIMDVKMCNTEYSANYYGKTKSDFQAITLIAIHLPFTNFLFVLFELVGLFPVVLDHVQKNNNTKTFLFAILNKSKKKTKKAESILIYLLKTLFSEYKVNVLFEENFSRLRGNCVKKVIIGSSNQIVESIIHKKIYSPKKKFLPGSCEMLIDFTCAVRRKVNFGIPTYSIREVGVKKALLIDRKNKRKIINIKQVKEELEKSGFVVQTLDFHSLSIEEQIKEVHSSTLLIGMHGAGLSNLFWLSRQKKSVVLEIFPFKFKKYTYQALSYCLGIKHFLIKTTKSRYSHKTFSSMKFKTGSVEYYRDSDTTVDIKQLKTVLKKINQFQNFNNN